MRAILMTALLIAAAVPAAAHPGHGLDQTPGGVAHLLGSAVHLAELAGIALFLALGAAFALRAMRGAGRNRRRG